MWNSSEDAALRTPDGQMQHIKRIELKWHCKGLFVIVIRWWFVQCSVQKICSFGLMAASLIWTSGIRTGLWLKCCSINVGYQFDLESWESGTAVHTLSHSSYISMVCSQQSVEMKILSVKRQNIGFSAWVWLCSIGHHWLSAQMNMRLHEITTHSLATWVTRELTDWINSSDISHIYISTQLK